MIARGKNGTKKIAAASNELFEGYVFSSDTGELWTYEYDLSNRLVKVNYSNNGTNGLKEKTGYLYDYRGLCIAKTSVKGTDYYEYTADGRLIYTENSDHTIEYIYSGTSVFAEVRKQYGDNETFYHHADHLGTTEVITDESGTVVWKASYEAFGSVLCENGTRVFEASFTGKFFDKDIGLYYFNARWYDAETGKFVTQDPARDGINWYVYCLNNPLKYFDPLGLESEEGTTNSNLWEDNVNKEDHYDEPRRRIAYVSPFGWSHYAPQRIFGYFNVYDAMSTLLIFNINGTKIEGETFTLRMWKGTYGLAGVGGEMVLYSKHGRSLNKNDLDSLGMTSSTFDLFDNESGEKIVYRTEKVSSFWTTAFRPSKHRNKSNITAEFNLNFRDEKAAIDFYDQIAGDREIRNAEQYYWNYSFFKKNQQSVNVVLGEDEKSVRITYGNKPPEQNKNKGKREVKNE